MLDKRCKYRVGVGADHGVLPLEKVKRVSAMQFHARVATAVRNAVGDGKWLLANRSSLLVDHALAAKHGVDPGAILAAAKKSLLASPHIASVYLKSDLQGSRTGDAVLELLRHSVDPERSADLYFVPKPGVIISGYRYGTTHGSPYDHDRNIPVIFFGAGIGAGTDSRKIRSIDVAPTMAAWVGVTPAADIDGQIYARDFKLVDQSDMIVSFVPELPGGKPGLSSGVERELQHAYEVTKEVYVVWKPASEPSPFITETATKVFPGVEEALQYFQQKGYIGNYQLNLVNPQKARERGRFG